MPDSATTSTSDQNQFPKLSLPATTDPPSDTNPPIQKTWLIFGATGHIGQSIVRSALTHGDLVCAVGQTYKTTLASMLNLLPDPTSTDQRSRFLPLLCDVRLRNTVATAISTCLDHFATIDIIANCSGYGVIGAFEDQDEHEIRNQFETNFMGTLNIIQLSLPYFRERGEGRYIIFSSTSGAQGVPGLAPYCATKYAVEGLIESMLYEVDGFGVRVTLVEPGHVRRDDVAAGGSPPPTTTTMTGKGQKQQQQQTKRPSPLKHQLSTTSNPSSTATPPPPSLPPYTHFLILKPSPPYATPDSPSKHAQRLVQWYGGTNQPTSVLKASELVWQLGHCSYPPLRLLLGSYAVESIRERLKSVIEEIEDWKWLHYPAVAGWGDGEGDEEDDHEEDGDGEEGGDAVEEEGGIEKEGKGNAGGGGEDVVMMDEG
ncbi:putative oxido [Cyphellophora attinorum]|uniref:Putative oxido n=1 Tax=Cyphellophora attinorum TaxID=1664694 RepID=A0A0N1H9R3_9EURO|nr:putative oxido [Phialophora attinorum]KPI44370.1 putative oxido [Phialophora attinorum]